MSFLGRPKDRRREDLRGQWVATVVQNNTLQDVNNLRKEWFKKSWKTKSDGMAYHLCSSALGFIVVKWKTRIQILLK